MSEERNIDRFDYKIKSNKFIELEKKVLEIVNGIDNIDTIIFDYTKAEKIYSSLNFMCQFIEKMKDYNDFCSSCFAHDIGIKYTQNFIDLIEKRKEKIILNAFLIKTYSLWKNMLRIGARYNLNDMAEYYDIGKAQKVYAPRKKALEAPIFYVNRSLLRAIGVIYPDGIQPQLVVYSLAPSSGKTLIQNLGSVMVLALHKLIYKTGSILRLSNEENNVNRFSASVISLIKSTTFLEIYPEFNEYYKDNKFKMFFKESVEEWKLMDSQAEASYFARTMHSTINSIRVKTSIMFDDPSKGLQDSQDKQEHDFINTLFWGDTSDRADNPDTVSVIVGGTQFAPFDIFNNIYETYESIGLFDDDLFQEDYLDIKKTENGNVVIIKVDIYDGNHHSIIPKIHSDEKLALKEKKLNELQQGLFDLVYRQRVTALEGMGFDYTLLKTYDRLPIGDNALSQLTSHSLAVIDPTRKGKDFFSMPIFKFNPTNGMYYLVDGLFVKKPIKMMYDEIVKMIIKYNVSRLCVENNTDESLSSIILLKVKSIIADYKIEILEEFSTEVKEQRINREQGEIRNKICFPSKACPKNIHLTKFMDNLTSYSFEKPNRNDDAPDSCCLFTSRLLSQKERINILSLEKRLPF